MRTLFSVLLAALVALGVHEVQAQVVVQGDCLPPATAAYSDEGAEHNIWCVGLPIERHTYSGLFLNGLTGCGSPPPSVPGAQVIINTTGTADFDYASDPPGTDPGHYSAPMGATMIVTFDHQTGATRFFDLLIQSFVLNWGYAPLEALNAPGKVSIEDVGDGFYRIESYFDMALFINGCGGEDSNFRYTLVPATPTGVASDPVTSLRLERTVPNPARSYAQIRFMLPSEDVVTLNVYDLAGRQVATLLEGKPMAAGEHNVQLDTRGWRPGCYYYRLAIRGASQTRMLAVVR